jgi:tetratricopeptide (TPR) repeat protein
LVLLVGLVYANSFPGAFIADDYSRVLGNPLVQHPDIRTIFRADYWGYGVNSGLHRPLTILSYALNRALFGPGSVSFHAINVLLHAGVVVLLLLTLGSLGVPSRVAWLAAALFAVHPIHTEVLDIVTGRAELLAAGFVLLGWRLAVDQPTVVRTAGTGLCYAAALLCKENAAAFPALLMAGDAFILRDFRAQWSRRWPLYLSLGVITAGWLAMRSWWLPFAHIPVNSIYPLDNPLVGQPPMIRLLGIAKIQAIYLSKLILPFRLQALYTADTIDVPSGGLEPQVAVILGVALLFGALMVHGWRKRRWYGFGLAFYLIAFAVTANILRLTTFLMAERFAYLPSAGFCLAIAALIATGDGETRPTARQIRAAAVLLLFFGGMTVYRNVDFRNSTALWTAEVKNAPGNARAWMFLGGAHEMEGRRQEAEQAYRAAIRIAPDFADASLSLGYLLLNEGRAREALDCFGKAYWRNPGRSPLLSLALARATLALNDPRASMEWLEEVAPYSTQLPEYWEVREAALNALEEGG